jgi:glutamine synthetase type III
VKNCRKQFNTKLKKAIETDESLELDVANVVAAAMKDWAIEKAPPISHIGFNR